MRISTMMMYNTAVANLARSAERMEEIQEVISSFKRINHLSDDPIGASRVVDYQSQLGKLAQYKNNIAQGQAWLGMSDSVLLDMQNLVTEAKTIAIAQSTATASRETRSAAAVQVRNLYEQLVSYANTTLGGSYIFGGSITGSAPFSSDGTYLGNSDDILVEIAEGIKAKINVAGSQFLMTDLNPALSIAPATAGSTSSSGLVAQNSNSIAASPATLSTYRVSFILTNGLRQEITYSTDDTPTRDELGAGIAAAVNSNDTLSQYLRAGYDAGTGGITFLAREAGEAGNAFAIDPDNTTAFEGAVNTSFAGGSLDIPADLTILAGVNDTFSITVDGTASGLITLAPGAYTATDLASLMQSRINADPLLSAAGVSVNVDYGITREGQFTITSGSTGVNSRVSLTSTAGRDLLQSIGLDRDFEVAGTTPTLLADLNGGAGVSAGTVTITDRAGNTAAIDLSAAVTITDVISIINASGPINVTAALNSAGNGIELIDTNPFPTQNLVVEDSATARDLGIVGNKPGTIYGTDLNPAVSGATRISALRGNTGLSLQAIAVVNGPHHETIDLNRAGSIDDVLTALNTLGADITAAINPSSRASLDVTSNNPDSTALVNEVVGGATSSDLGIQGGANVFKTLSALQEALEKNDRTALLSMLDQFDRILDTLVERGSEVGVRTNQLEAINNRIKTSETAIQGLKSDIEDADMVEYLTKFTLQKTALEAILTAAGQSLQLSLLNFLR